MLHISKRIRCHVCIDGKDLDECKTETKGNHISCFIAAEEGKQYVVTVWNDAYELTNDDTLIAELYVDGSTKVIGKTIDYHDKCELKGKRDERGRIQPLTFDRLITKAADSSKPAQLPDLSTITVAVKRVKVIGETPSYDMYPDRYKYSYRSSTRGSGGIGGSDGDVDERTAKQNNLLRDRITRYGQPKYETIRSRITHIPHSPPKKSGGEAANDFVRFTFQYRSRELLEASGIIPISEIARAADDEHLLQDVKQEGLRTSPRRRSARFRNKNDESQSDKDPFLATDIKMDDTPSLNISPKKRAHMHIQSASNSSRSNSEDDSKSRATRTRPARKSRKLKPVIPEIGTMIDLEGAGGPVESHFLIEKREVEMIDLVEDGDGEGQKEREDVMKDGEEGHQMNEGGFFVPAKLVGFQ
ncbi:hypothetical protein HK097_002380 [Rhizophlyctis rosea]|uniref:DUF7918 domain-containing protein n=1 Tax=Rhizophlyctis rosea TaxID=64517 RepID=A0AAD5S5P5_9FUNG|nr:hypothetical protein HK097_002380 [Rhizophlyctis rosea]